MNTISNISDLQNPNISRHSIVLGFAYSLTPEGLPGTYNNLIAEQLKSILIMAGNKKESDRPWIGMQWEIFDALEHGWKETTPKLLDVVPLSHVGALPLFTPEDIGDQKTIITHLKMCFEDVRRQQAKQNFSKPSTQAGRKFAEKIAQLIEAVGYHDEQASVFDAAMFDEIKLAQYFNQMLHDDEFHTNFYENNQPVLELHDLYRTNIGSVGVESRQLPPQQPKLRRFQKIRVNRFIIESIFPDAHTLKRGKYLSTRGVLNQVKQVIKDEGGRDIRYAFVFGHPEHSPRCRRQTIESGWEAGWNLTPSNVYDVNNSEANEIKKWQGDQRWDLTTAQMWCRSKQNWDDYERMGKARLD